jgi:protein SCO1/2
MRKEFMNMKQCCLVFCLGLLWSSASFAGEPHLTNAPCCSKEAATLAQATNSPALSERSLYQVESSWTNDAGTAMPLGKLLGKPQVITMFFASCEYACPLLVSDMQRIEEALPPELRSQVGFTLITFDTERDTPEALKKYRENHQLGKNWTLLRGNPDDVLELAALLGVKFKKDERGQFAHSNTITVLDRKGEIVVQQIGLNRDPQSAVATLQKLLRHVP